MIRWAFLFLAWQFWIKVCLQYNSDCHLIMFPWRKSYNQIEILILTSNEYESLSFLRKLIGFSLIVFFHHKIVIHPSNFLKWWYLIHAFYKDIAFGHDGYNGITIQIRKKNCFTGTTMTRTRLHVTSVVGLRAPTKPTSSSKTYGNINANRLIDFVYIKGRFMIRKKSGKSRVVEHCWGSDTKYR